MTAPIIGITGAAEQARWGAWDLPAVLLPATYPKAITAAGGVPVLLPPAPGMPAVLARLDGLVLAGGPDVDPARYGAVAGPQTDPPSHARDEAEFAVLAAAEATLPVLAICRGMQLLNVHRGGTLFQHVPDVVGHTGHSPAPDVFGHREVTAAAGSCLAAAIGRAPVTVACHHHQAVDRLGEGLVGVATADDGLLEAVEDPSRPFLVAVQWHPEVAADAGLFVALVRAAAAHRGTGWPGSPGWPGNPESRRGRLVEHR